MKISRSIAFFTLGLALAAVARSEGMGPRDLSVGIKISKPLTREDIRYRSRLEMQGSTSIFQLASSDDQILKTKVFEYLSGFQMDPELEIRKISEMSLPTGRHSLRYKFYWRGIPLYNIILSTHLTRGELYFVGEVPVGTLALTSEDLKNTPSMNQVAVQLDQLFSGEDFLYQPTDKNQLKIFPCIVDDQEYQFASCFSVEMKGVHYNGASNLERIIDLDRSSFSATGSISYYPKNPSSPVATENFELAESDKLENKYFTTAPYGAERSVSISKKFEFATSNPSFPEANIFAQANKMLEWYRSIGYNWDNKAIKLVMNSTDSANINNAGYYPRGTDGTSGPLVITGKGDGDILQNLSLDSDVVAHEIGHHMIFRSITSTKYDDNSTIKNHSGALHEGMADFFAYARSGDSCLGESICPAGSSLCIIPTCLRTAALSTTDWNYESSFYKSQPDAGVHIKGMLVAATLWDAMKAGGNNLEFAKLTLNSIDYLKSPASSYSDLFIALVSSDQELFAGKYCPAIFASAKARGLGTLAAAAGSCEKPKVIARSNSSAPIVGAAGATSGSSSAGPPKATLKRTSSSGCSAGTTNWSNMFHIILLAPLLYSRKRK